MCIILFVLLLCNVFVLNATTCTTQSVETSLGITLGSWSSTYGSLVASNIVITTPILVDVSSITAQGITIASGGKLYFDWSRSISLSANFILVSSGGEFHIGTESCPFTQQVTITLTGTTAYVDPMFGSNFFGVSSGAVLELHGAKGLGNSWTRISQTAVAGSTQIQVVDSVSGWQVGDQIVIATTDFSPLQSEVLTITQISGSTITFTPPLVYNHFGKITYGVDERAEVGLLSRNILIQGAPAAGFFGGHLMITKGFAAVHVEGVEFNNMGQDQIARYPFHFHMCDNVTVGTYVRYNSVVNSNFRCFTIHTTNGVLLQGNVAYNNYGHCYFLEDGIEQNNQLIGNLAILTKPKDFGQHIGSDITGSGVSSFWISNPQNIIEDNVAVGSYTAGFWFITRLGARGVSACLPEYQNLPYVPANQMLQSFYGNTAHSCIFGLGIESTDWDANDVPVQTCDTPVANWQPTFANGTMPNTYFENFTAHHVGNQGVWARMPNIVLVGARLADNYESIEYATSGDHPPYPSLQLVENAVIVGFSENTGNQANDAWQTWDVPSGSSRPFDDSTPFNGMKLYDGAQAIVNSVFINFPASPRMDAPLGARLADQSQVATTNYVQGLSFQNVAYRFWVLDNSMDGGLTTNFKDVDGSVSGYSSSTMLRNFEYYATPNCKTSSSFMLVCPHEYSQLWVLDMQNNGVNNQMVITRSDHVGTNHSAYSLEFTGFMSSNIWRYQPIVSIGSNYLVRFENHVPAALALQLNNAQQGDNVGVAICYPAGTIIQSVYRGYSNYVGSPIPNLSGPLTAASTIPLSTAASSTNVLNGGNYYYDSVHSILYVNVVQRSVRSDYSNFCPNGGCDFVWVSASFTGSAAARDCTQDAYNSGFQITSGTWLNQQLTPASNIPVPAAPSSSSPSSPAAPAAPAAPATTPSTPSPTTAPSCTCPNPLSCCGGACYNPSVYQCNGNRVCLLGMLTCGVSCYNPGIYACENDYLVPL